MPLPRQSVGMPGTEVIPTKWSEAPRLIIEGTLSVEAGLCHPGGEKGPLDPVTGTYPVTPNEAYWAGQCRIQVAPVFGGGAKDAAGEPVTEVAYLIVISLDATDEDDDIRINDLLDLGDVDFNGDTTLTGRTLTVHSIARGSLAWERDLVCVDHLTPAPEPT